jgi:hypothetical protein
MTFRGWLLLNVSGSAERPKLGDGGHEVRRLEQKRDAAVRCSACARL